jgi:hypothetical protein
MSYLGDIRLGDTLDCKLTTVSTTGAPTTLAGTPVISAYVGNSTTELTAGITLTVDFDGRTGLHHIRVVATSGNGYATASNYQLVITTGTVGGTSVVGYVVGEFSIEGRSALMPTTAARTLAVAAAGQAGVDWANVASPTTANGLTGTTIATSQVVASVTGAVGSVTGAVGSVTGAVGSVSGSVASVTGNVGGNVSGTVGSVVGAVGSVTGNVGGNVVGSVATVTDLTVTANAEPTTPPASNAALSAKIAWLFALAKNKITQTSTTQLLKANDGTTTIGTSTVSDDGTTGTRGVFS